MENAIYLILLLLSSFIPAIIIFFLKESSTNLRNILNLTGIFFKIILVFIIFQGVKLGVKFKFSYEIVNGIEFVLKADELSLLFAILSSVLWLFTTVYAISYLKNSPNQGQFFGFFSLCVMSTVAIAIAGNLFTFFIFYELLTLVTFPLVMHNKNEASKQAAISYLKYTIFGGLFFLIGIVGLYMISGVQEFVSGGFLSQINVENHKYLQIIFVILLIGVGVKAAIFPLHGWLPLAMAAPAPVSALLHAVAVVKAGAFGIVRIVYEVYGIDFAYSLGLLTVLMIVAVVTIVYGSIKALLQIELKKVLAYSTVSQVSYILLGVSLFGPIGTVGGLVHLVHQGIMKITLFFCAGAFAKTYGIKEVSQMNGLGKKMPLVSFSFTIASLGMIGIPPIAGFVTKWYLALSAVENNLWFILVVIGISALLNAAYFLPILYRIWFLEPENEKQKIVPTKYFESRAFLVIPALLTALISLLLGIFAFSDWSALSWVEYLVKLEYK
ncbi:proton-conducting transporter membrane subunit [Arcobacter sp. FWKO B]|uniref:proton-conducting transporter transmembrane domain-containing protein n=1 Tax=Arcobacter sp. FWKO B TaxID=2593672 RepID=UPI0018A5279E|nr:proton-conducting transporter membrane subunit [Arcobacter sp. FWKO B]QOG13158.1 monovalent cation/H+ antiporter subunit D family protein [Arcobacter sp. FWKO B]